jgi:hypothetical protein
MGAIIELGKIAGILQGFLQVNRDVKRLLAPFFHT